MTEIKVNMPDNKQRVFKCDIQSLPEELKKLVAKKLDSPYQNIILTAHDGYPLNEFTSLQSQGITFGSVLDCLEINEMIDCYRKHDGLELKIVDLDELLQQAHLKDQKQQDIIRDDNERKQQLQLYYNINLNNIQSRIIEDQKQNIETLKNQEQRSRIENERIITELRARLEETEQRYSKTLNSRELKVSVQIQQLNSDISQLRLDARQKELIITQGTEERTRMQELINQLNADKLSLESRNGVTTQNLNTLQIQQTQTQLQKEESERTVKLKEIELKKGSTRIKDLEESLRRTQEEVSKIQEEIRIKEADLRKKGKEIDDLNGELLNTTKTKKIIENDLEKAFLETKQDLEAKKTLYESELNKEKKKFQEKQAELDQQTQQLHLLKQTHQSAVDKLQKQQVEDQQKIYQQVRFTNGFKERLEKLKRKCHLCLPSIQLETSFEKLYKSQKQINNFEADPNVNTGVNDVKISRVEILSKELEEKFNLEVSGFSIKDCYTLRDTKTISITKTLNPVLEGTKQQIFFLKDKSDNKVYVYKRFIGIPEAASQAELFENQGGEIIWRFLYSKYLDMSKEKKIAVKDLIVRDLYFVEDGAKFYLCELIQDGKYTKINGGDYFFEDDVNKQFCNSFSYFTYVYSKQYLLVSYVQTVDNILSDLIVSSEDGSVDINDLGIDEISKFIVKLKSDKKLCGEEYLAPLGNKYQIV